VESRYPYGVFSKHNLNPVERDDVDIALTSWLGGGKTSLLRNLLLAEFLSEIEQPVESRYQQTRTYPDVA
jgi:hypothetical protein